MKSEQSVGVVKGRTLIFRFECSLIACGVAWTVLTPAPSILNRALPRFGHAKEGGETEFCVELPHFILLRVASGQQQRRREAARRCQNRRTTSPDVRR